MTAIAVPHILRAARGAGVRVDDLARRLGLPPSPAFEDRVAVPRLVALWEAILARAGDPGLPARAAVFAERHERSLVAMLAGAQDTLGGAVQVMLRYWDTVTDAFRWRPLRGATTFALVCDPAGPLHRAGWRAQLEFDAADLVHVSARLTGGAARPLRVAFVHRAPAAVDAHAQVFGVPPRFSSERMELVFPRAALGLPLAGAKPELGRVIEPHLRAAQERARRARTVAGAVREVLPRLLRAGDPGCPRAAAALGMQRRTLERRLAGEGTSFGALLDEVRFRLAAAWLPEVAIADVAERLAYSEVRAFDRAFRRWSGETPAAFRAHLAAARRRR